ncbi:MAG: GNAT family N-acetyltransferase, partial [Solirubrobacterales bacterium]
MSVARAELIEDRGEAAVSNEFFRSRAFLDAEGVTHTLRIEGDGGVLLAPLIVREIEETGERDGLSPYGYPGVVGGEG